jgi:2-polyprenyl-3-methyl-5-hydroxy-6-metoxy-1,4-benzoquinol methylase
MALIHYTNCPICHSTSIREVLRAKDYTVSGQVFPVWQCDDCTARFTQDVPDMESISPFYQSENYISHSDTRKGVVNRLYHIARGYALQKKHQWVSQSGKLKNGKLLDAGSGTGAFLHIMQQKGWQVTGVEPDEGARQKAAELYGLKILPATELFTLPEHSFDVITLWHVLEHVHPLHDYIDQLKKLLCPGGTLYIAVPNYESMDEKIYSKYWAAYDVPRHLYHFSPKAMQTLLAAHQLKIITIQPMHFDPFYISLLSEKYQHGNNNIFRGLINGYRSYRKAVRNTSSCSSVLYIIQSGAA